MFDVEEWLIDSLDSAKLSGVKEINATCPFSDCGKHQKLYANRKTGAFICFACDRRGKSVISLVAEVEELTHKEAAAKVLRGITANRRRGTLEDLREQVEEIGAEEDESVEAKELIDVAPPTETIPIFKPKRKKEWRIPVYLRERGITRESAQFWDLGFCTTGDYQGRLVIPIECPNGRSFTARDMTDEQDPRYMNPTGINHRKLLFGWKTVEAGGDIVICEGPFDTIALRQAGFNSVALLGKVLLDSKFALLCQLDRARTITVMLDPEARVDTFKAALSLSVHFDRIYIAKLPAGIDPGEASPKLIRKTVDDAVLFDGARTHIVTAALEASSAKILARFG